MSDQLLASIVERLSKRTEVVAAWLAGSRGRGTNDKYSDIDIWVAIDDAYMALISSAPLTYVNQITPTIMHVIAPEIAPKGGAFVGSWVPDDDLFTQVDWYLTPSSIAIRAADTKPIFGDVPIEVPNAPASLDQDSTSIKVAENLALGLQMVNNMIKNAQRGYYWSAIEHAQYAERCINSASFWFKHNHAPSFQNRKPSILPLPTRFDTGGLQQIARLLIDEVERVVVTTGISEQFNAPISALRKQIN